jgi:4-hydroxybenzoate polyprenyltransferase
MINRWWIYQKERFPLAAHAPLILVFSYSALSYSAILRNSHHFPGLFPASVAFVTALLLFLQLRIADEFKDFDDDSRYRPYRPVPRGLIKLKELGAIFVGAGAVQLALTLWLYPPLSLLLLVVWIYLALMSKEFFIRRWLKAHPIHYLWSHMFIMPLVDFYVTGCNWMVAGAKAPVGIWWFLIISFFNGIVLEFGRKIRAPEDEEVGVDTYTALWGRRKAVAGWLTAQLCGSYCALKAASIIHFSFVVALVLTIMLTLSIVAVTRFLKTPVTKNAGKIELLSGIWTLSMYLSLGIAPALAHLI